MADQPKEARSARILLFVRSLSRIAVLVSMLLFFFGYTQRAEAGITSFLSGLFSDTTEAASNKITPPETRTISSQNVAILTAAINSDPVMADRLAVDINIVGSSALLAESGPLGTVADVEEFNSGADTISVYVVRSGDTLQKISDMFGVSVNTIMWGNDLRGPKDIKIGQELIILPVSGIKYVIRRGDTITAIAKRHGGSADEIIKFNNLEDGYKLIPGDELIIPNGEIRYVAPSRSAPGSTNLIRTFIDETVNSLDYFIRPIIGGRKTQGLHGKNGVDLAPSCRCSGKEPILASADGQVLVAKNSGWNGGYGNYVVIAHPNGTQTLYAHMYSATVRAGAMVGQGEKIGYVGSSGNSSGPHVHFEIRGARNPF